MGDLPLQESDGDTQPEPIQLTQCYHCGTPLPEGATTCPRCGRRQVRLCYCGNYVPVTAPRCPYCGADWSLAFRVRRKSRSRKVNWKLLAAYSAAGALGATALAAFVNSLVGGLALRSLPPGQSGLPASFTARLALAMETIGRVFSTVGHKIASAGGGPGVVILLLASGAAAGALLYLHQVGRLRLRWPFGRRKVKRRRRQGVY